MHKRTGQALLGAALVLLSGVAVTRAEGNSPSSHSSATSASAATRGTTVRVTLTEWSLGFRQVTVRGKATFEVTNAGKFPHALALEGKIGGKDFEVSTGVLMAGQNTTLVVELPAGTYHVYCPVDAHEDRGMQGSVTFQ